MFHEMKDEKKEKLFYSIQTLVKTWQIPGRQDTKKEWNLYDQW